jgi:hypothetical protein
MARDWTLPSCIDVSCQPCGSQSVASPTGSLPSRRYRERSATERRTGAHGSITPLNPAPLPGSPRASSPSPEQNTAQSRRGHFRDHEVRSHRSPSAEISPDRPAPGGTASSDPHRGTERAPGVSRNGAARRWRPDRVLRSPRWAAAVACRPDRFPQQQTDIRPSRARAGPPAVAACAVQAAIAGGSRVAITQAWWGGAGRALGSRGS